MSEKNNHSVQVLFLDADRNPIKGQAYLLNSNGKSVRAVTGEDGLTKKIQVPRAGNEVQIAIERFDKSTKLISRVASEMGNKLVTVISPRLKLEGPTLPHPQSGSIQTQTGRSSIAPVHDPQKTREPTAKTKFGLVSEPRATKDDLPMTIVEGEIPNLEFLDQYNGEVMEDGDYRWAAKELGVEYAAVKAFAVVESGGQGFLKVGDRYVPKILYERHKFAKFTNNRYSKLNPDISLPPAYYNTKDRYVLADKDHKAKKKVPNEIEYYRPINKKDDKKTKDNSTLFLSLVQDGKLIEKDNRYLDGIHSYWRLVKAYKLDPVAALESCSWGAFQIMGEFWRTMKYSSAQDFTKAVSRSPKEQAKCFVLYVKYVNPKIIAYLKAKDWAAVAAAYNGPSYKANKYDEKMQAAYEKFRG